MCVLGNFKAALEQVLCEKLSEISNHLLVKGLGGVGWKVENLNFFKKDPCL